MYMLGRAFIAMAGAFFFCLCFLPGASYAQPNTQEGAKSHSYSHTRSPTDSLKEMLEQSTGSRRVELLVELSRESWRSHPDEANNFLNEAVRQSVALERIDLEAEARSLRGYVRAVHDNHVRALEDYHAALQLYRDLEDREGEARVLNNYGILYQDQSDYSRALDYFFRSLSIREQLEQQGPELRTLISIGSVYEKREEYDEAVSFYRKSLELSRQANDTLQVAIAATQAGKAYNASGDTENALKMYKVALRAAENMNSDHARSTILLNMSGIYQSREAYDRAIEVNKQEIEQARLSGSPFLEAQGLENLAGIYRDMGEHEQAFRYYTQSLNMYERLQMGEGALRLRIKLLGTLLDDGDFKKAAEMGSTALVQAKAQNSLDRQDDILELLVSLSRQRGEYQVAMSYQQELLAVQDTLFNRDKARQISEMQTRYDTKQKEQEIALLEKEREQEALLRNALLAGLVLVGIIGFLIFHRQRLKIKKNRTELENKELKEEKLERDLDHRNQQLTTHTLHLVQKNKSMKDLKKHINEIREDQNGSLMSDLHKLENMVDYSFNLDEDWKQFEIYFEQLHNGFFDELKERYPDLTSHELRLSALVKLNLSIKEIATIMGITPDSVKTARYRLRKKLDIETGDNLTEFMMQVERDIR